MKRYKSIDITRGICMIIMLAGHMLNWWLTPEDQWLFDVLASVFAPIGASGFVFLSGTVTFLSYQNNLLKPEASDKLYLQKIRNIYLLRCIFLIIISFCINLVVVMMYNDINHIWTWHILQTIGFALLMTWPFLKTSKNFRLIIVITALLLNQLILDFLKAYEGEYNYYGLLYYLLYHPIRQYPIIPFFATFLLGTIIGDLLFKVNQIEDPFEREYAIKKKFIFPLLISGSIITALGIWYLFPSFLYWSTISAHFYSIGIIIILISVLIGIEEFKHFQYKKNHRFFFFYSYYSFTIYFLHIFLTFLFYQQLNVVTVWVPVIIVLILMTILLKIMYDKLGPKASIKAGLALASFFIATKLYERNRKKILTIKTQESIYIIR